MSKKLWEWGDQKRKPCVSAINAQSDTSLEIVAPEPSPYIIVIVIVIVHSNKRSRWVQYNAVNGDSRKFPEKPTTEQ